MAFWKRLLYMVVDHYEKEGGLAHLIPMNNPMKLCFITFNITSTFKLFRNCCTVSADSIPILCAHRVSSTYSHSKFCPACPLAYHAALVSLPYHTIPPYDFLSWSTKTQFTKSCYTALIPSSSPSCLSQHFL